MVDHTVARVLGLMDIPREVLPKVHPSSHVYGAAQPGIWGSGDFLAGLGQGLLVWLLSMGCSATFKTFRQFITPPDLLKGE